MMLTAAFDASGHESDQPYMVVGGFVSSEDEWIKFNVAWRARLALEGVPYFRLSEFSHPRHMPFIRDLIDIVAQHAFRRFACFLRTARLPDHMREEFNLNAYSLAALSNFAPDNDSETHPSLVMC